MDINLGIQLLRALATLAVAATHFQMDLEKLTGPVAGFPAFISHTGIAFDFFFLISGFVLVYASESLFGTLAGPWTFYKRRLIRIIPMYWLATAAYLVMAFAIPSFGKTYSLQSIVGSFMFIPVPRLDGLMEPVVGQGWTLNYEMFFYVIFALAVFAPRRTAVAIASLLLVAAVIAGRTLPLPTAFDYWCQPIILEFIFGMVLGLAYRERVRIPAWAGAGLVVTGLAIVALLPAEPATYGLSRAIRLGGPAALIVAGLTLGELARPSRPMRLLSVIGDASFSLYLFHSFPNRGVLYLALWLGLDPAAAPWLYLAVALILGCVMAVAMYYAIEAPTTRTLRRWLRCDSAHATRQAPTVALGSPPVPPRERLG